MTANSIHPDTRLGYVHLTVNDLDRSITFYENSLGFELHRREGHSAYLGAGREDLVTLTEDKNARHPARAAGLYHFATLVPSRVELAQVLRRIAETETPVQGFADHAVSEAIYLADPDGNGIEMYRDRPRSEWYDARGSLLMTTEALDLQDLMGELRGQAETWPGLHSDTVLGHMHLKVSDIRSATNFYRNIIGFDLMTQLAGSASFMSAGGYHHHLGLNTWESLGAPPAPPGAIGLRQYSVIFPTLDALREVAARVRTANINLEETDEGLLLRDPSLNALVLTSAQINPLEITAVDAVAMATEREPLR